MALLSLMVVAVMVFVAVELYRGRDQVMADGLQRRIEGGLPANASQLDVLSYMGSIGARARVTTADERDSFTKDKGIEPGTLGVRASLDQEGTWLLYPDRNLEIFVVIENGIAERIVVGEYTTP